jgi:hypothetical protein
MYKHTEEADSRGEDELEPLEALEDVREALRVLEDARGPLEAL